MREWGGKTIAMSIAETDRLAMWGMIRAQVEKGAMLHTDDHRSHFVIQRKQYAHESVNHSDYKHARGPVLKHLQQYINEAAFHLNEGNCGVDMVEQMASLVAAMNGKRIPYPGLVA